MTDKEINQNKLDCIRATKEHDQRGYFDLLVMCIVVFSMTFIAFGFAL